MTSTYNPSEESKVKVFLQDCSPPSSPEDTNQAALQLLKERSLLQRKIREIEDTIQHLHNISHPPPP